MFSEDAVVPNVKPAYVLLSKMTKESDPAYVSDVSPTNPCYRRVDLGFALKREAEFDK